MDRLYLIAPVLNESPNVPTLLQNCARVAERLAPCRTTFLLVDDGSTDDTVASAEAAKGPLDLVVLRHDRNRGPGAAFGTAFEHLAGQLQPDDFVATMEGDNTSRTDTLLRMLERSEREDLDIVLASPYAYGGGLEGTSWWRRFLSAGANGLFRGLVGIHGIHTMSCFFRVFRGRAILALQGSYGPRIIERCGFEGVVEMLKKAMNLGLSVSEMPVRVDWAARRGASKMKVFRTIRGYLALCFRVRRWRRPAQAPTAPQATRSTPESP